jgi:superfamily I DNA and/or RNA helicase
MQIQILLKYSFKLELLLIKNLNKKNDAKKIIANNIIFNLNAVKLFINKIDTIELSKPKAVQIRRFENNLFLFTKLNSIF